VIDFGTDVATADLTKFSADETGVFVYAITTTYVFNTIF